MMHVIQSDGPCLISDLLCECALPFDCAGVSIACFAYRLLHLSSVRCGRILHGCLLSAALRVVRVLD